MDLPPIWAPHVLENLKDSELVLYLEFSCSACIPSGACNVDRALQVLYQSDGDIKLALEKLLSSPKAQDSINNHYDQAIWTEDEVRCFERLIKFHGKNFSQISVSLRTKTVKQCVEFYYLWKRSPFRNSSLSPRLLGPIATTNTIPPNLDINNNNNNPNCHQPADTSFTSTTTTTTTTTTTNLDCDGTTTNKVEEFPCKVCGRVFLKIKSRSAHMKRHKNER